MSNEKSKKSRLSLWLLAAVCIAPVAASYIAYYFMPPSGHVNYGELIEARPLPDVRLAFMDGKPLQWRELKGKWLIVTLDSGSCDTACQRKLFYMRQVRLAQGKEMDRVERVWLITDAVRPADDVVRNFQGTLLIHAAGSNLLQLFPAQRAASDHLYVVDPLGNLMMRFPRDADPSKIIKDISRLLKISRIG